MCNDQHRWRRQQLTSSTAPGSTAGQKGTADRHGPPRRSCPEASGERSRTNVLKMLFIKHLRTACPGVSGGGEDKLWGRKSFFRLRCCFGADCITFRSIAPPRRSTPTHVPTPGLGQSERQNGAGKASCYPVSGRCRGGMPVSWWQGCG